MLLAQSNIALFRWSLNDPRMAEFVSQIATMNQLAESSAGFVWRFSEEYDATGRPTPFDDPLLFFNMSVWRDVQSLRHYVFQSAHAAVLRRSSEWTRPATSAPLVMWWLEDEAPMPTVADAIARFTALQAGDRTVNAFTFSDAPARDR